MPGAKYCDFGAKFHSRIFGNLKLIFSPRTVQCKNFRKKVAKNGPKTGNLETVKSSWFQKKQWFSGFPENRCWNNSRPVSIEAGAIWFGGFREKSGRIYIRWFVGISWNLKYPHIYSWIWRLRRQIPLHSGTTDTRSIGNPGSRIRGASASRRRNNLPSTVCRRRYHAELRHRSTSRVY